MAYKIIAEYVRPDTGVEFPKTSDHNSDYYTWMRDYYTNNGIALSFDLSEDELTLTVTLEMANKDVWTTYDAAHTADGRGDATKALLNSDFASRGITLEIKEDDNGTVSTLKAEGPGFSA